VPDCVAVVTCDLASASKIFDRFIKKGEPGTATGYGLDGSGIECRRWRRFSASVQTGPGAHPASCTMGTGSFRG